MLHLTLNTRHAATLPADLVLPQTRELLRPIIAAGGGTLPGIAAAYRIQIEAVPDQACAGFTLFRGSAPLSTNVVALSDATAPAVWASLERIWIDLGDRVPAFTDAQPGMAVPEMPEHAPWLATLLLPPIAQVAAQDIGFIGHMAACFGLLIAEKHRTP